MKRLLLSGCLFFTLMGNAQYLESEWLERDTWMRVAELLDFATVSEGDIVADVGCHEGYLSVHLARRVGESGKVYAVDVKNYRLEALQVNASDRKLTNIQTVLGDYDNPNLPVGIFDSIFVIDTYHEMESHEAMLGHLKNALKENGKLVLLEKLKDHARGKTRRQQTNSHTLSSSYVKKELREAGFKIVNEVQDFGDWENDKEKQMWVVVAMINKNP